MFKQLLIIIIFLLIANTISISFMFYTGHDSVYGLVPLFNFDMENNIPTLYSSIALIVCSILLTIIAVTHKRLGSSYLPWVGLAIIFLFLSIDETASLHEQLIQPLRETLNTSGLLYFAWVIPYGAALLVFLAVYFRFLVNLQKEVMILFVVSGATYVLGALGFELIGGLQADLHGSTSITYSFITTLEELLEMLGIAIFIYALLVYISKQFNNITITIR